MAGTAAGGRNLYGFPIGVLMLETEFPRIPGDPGNALTFPCPVRHWVVPGATNRRVVAQGDPALLGPFIDAGRELVAEGVRAVTTTCGFLSLFQEEMAAALGVPVFASSLMQLPLIRRTLSPDRRIGVITFEAASLAPRHFAAAGAGDVPVSIAGLDEDPDNHLYRVIREDLHSLDPERARSETAAIARRLCDADPRVGALLLECTNLVPYAHEVQRETGLPVFDFYSLLRWVYHAVARAPFPRDA